MKTDKELLELAAKAFGVELEYRRGSDAFYFDDEEIGRDEWHPLGNDGQALRLAVKLEMDIEQYKFSVEVNAWFDGECIEVIEQKISDCRLAATRRAIVRAAAAIGEKL